MVELRLPMSRVACGFETEFPAANRGYFNFEPAAVFRPRRLPYASVLYGPLLFALPIPDVDRTRRRRARNGNTRWTPIRGGWAPDISR